MNFLYFSDAQCKENDCQNDTEWGGEVERYKRKKKG